MRSARFLLFWLALSPSAIRSQAESLEAQGFPIDPTYVTLRPGSIRDVTVSHTSCDLVEVRAQSMNPGRVEVYARDAGGNILPGNGELATVAGENPVVFALVGQDAVAPSEYVDVRFCWTEATPCTNDNCAGFPGSGFGITTFLFDDATTFGGNLNGELDLDPVYTGTGELVIPPMTFLDLGPVDFAIYYANGIRTDNNFVSRLGPGWSHSYDWYLSLVEFTESVVEIYTPAGEIIRFEKGPFDDDYVLRPYAGIPYQLAKSGDDFVLADPFDGKMYRFDTFPGNLLSIDDGKGNVITLVHVSNLLSQVTDGRGRTLDYTYVSGRLDAVTDGTRTVSFDYAGGQLSSVTDPAGGVSTYTYDPAAPAGALITSATYPRGNTRTTQVFDSAASRVASQTDADGNSYTFAYDDVAGERAMTDPLGNTKRHTYADRALTTFEDEAAQSIAIAYDALDRRARITDRNGGVTEITYHEPSGKVAAIAHADGTTTTLAYAERSVPLLRGGGASFRFHDLISRTRPDGATESFTYDGDGNLLTHTDPAGKIWSFTYDATGRVLTSTNPAGGPTVNTYNPDGTQATVTDPAGNTTSFGYDALFRVTSITHAGGGTESFTYDALDRLLTRTDELGRTTSFAYDLNGNLVAAATPLGHTWSFGYDAMDRLVTIHDPLGHTRLTTAFDPLQRPASATDALGNVTLFAWDARGRPVSTTDPLGHVRATAFDPEGVVSSLTDPLGRTTTFTANLMGRITGATSPLGSSLGFGYDAMGRLASVEDQLGNTSTLSYDPRGLMSAVSLPAPGVAVAFGRNDLGMLAAVTDPNGESWSRSYDDRGLLVSTSDPLGNTFALSYDSRQHIDEITLPGGLGTVGFARDATGRVTTESYTDGTTLSFTYDADGRLTSASSPDATITLAYDAAGRITGCNGLDMTYDAAGRLTSVTLAPGKTVSYTYDARDLVTAVVDWVGGSTDLGYDEAGRLVSMTRPNGTGTTYTYDDDDRLVTIDEGVLGSITMARNARGDLLSAARDLPLAAMPSPSALAPAYDAASQVASHAHDALGRVTDDGSRAYTWGLAHLRSIDDGSGPVDFGHDAFGNVVTRAQDGETRNLVWNYGIWRLPPVAVVRDGAGVDLSYYVHTPGGLLLHAIDAAGDVRRYYHFDEVGSTTFRTGESGTVTEAFAYGPYGEVLDRTDGGEELFTFHGRFGVMAEGDLYRMRARLYDPVIGRFRWRDPLGGVDPRTINPYQGLSANPRRHVDPMGTNVANAYEPIAGRENAWAWLGAYFGAMRIGSGTSLGHGVPAAPVQNDAIDLVSLPGLESMGSPVAVGADDLGRMRDAGAGTDPGRRSGPVNNTEAYRKFGMDPNGFGNGGFYYQPGQVFCCGDYRGMDEELEADDPRERSFLVRSAFTFIYLTRYGLGLGTVLDWLFFGDLWEHQELVQELRDLECPIKTPVAGGGTVECQLHLLHEGDHRWFGFGGRRSGKPLTWPPVPKDIQDIREAFPNVFNPRPLPYGHPDRP